jgi:hypothetical protein
MRVNSGCHLTVVMEIKMFDRIVHRHLAPGVRPGCPVCSARGDDLGRDVMSQPIVPRRPPTTFMTVMCGVSEAGTILGCPGCWVARSNGGDYLGTFLSQRAARRAIERHLAAQG